MVKTTINEWTYKFKDGEVVEKVHRKEEIEDDESRYPVTPQYNPTTTDGKSLADALFGWNWGNK